MVEDGGLWQRQKWKQSNFGFGIYKGVFGMTRREEIKQKALSKYPQGTNRYNKFIEGAKWADKTMIEKACEYLRQSLYNTPIFEHDEDETPVDYVCASCCDSVEEFIENFRKAMQNE